MITYLQDLYQKASKTLTQNDESWRSFLDTLGRYYKRDLSTAVLIHVQNPNALLFGAEKDWQQVGRTLKENAQSIAVLNMSGRDVTIENFFDISQTLGTEESYQRVLKSLWRVEESNKLPLMNLLNQKYNLTATSLEMTIWKIIQSRVSHYAELNTLDENQIKLLQSSMYYVLGTRCNLDFGTPEFKGLQNCNTVEKFVDLGENITDLVRPLLQELGTEIAAIERSKNHEQSLQADLQQGSGRVSPPQSRTDPTEILQGGGENGRNLVGVHQGQEPSLDYQTSYYGQTQLQNSENGRYVGEEKGRNLTETSGKAPHAPDGGHHGGSGTFEPSLSTGRGTDPSHLPDLNTPPNGNNTFSLGGFFVVPDRNKPKPNPESIKRPKPLIKPTEGAKTSPLIQMKPLQFPPKPVPTVEEPTKEEVIIKQLRDFVVPEVSNSPDFVDRRVYMYTDPQGEVFTLSFREENNLLIVYDPLLAEQNEIPDLAIGDLHGLMFNDDFIIPPILKEIVDKRFATFQVEQAKRIPPPVNLHQQEALPLIQLMEENTAKTIPEPVTPQETVVETIPEPVLPHETVVETIPEPVLPQETVVETIPEPVPPHETVVETIPKPVLPQETVVETILEPVLPQETVVETIPEPVLPQETVVETIPEPVPPHETVVETIPEPVPPQETVVETILEPVPPLSMEEIPIQNQKSTIMYSDLVGAYQKNRPDFVDKEMNLYKNEQGEEFVFGFTEHKHGIEVWNYLQFDVVGQKRMAHITNQGELEFLTDSLPEEAKAEIEQYVLDKFPKQEVAPEPVETTEEVVNPLEEALPAQEIVTPAEVMKPVDEVIPPQEAVTPEQVTKPEEEVIPPQEVVTPEQVAKPVDEVIPPQEVVPPEQVAKPVDEVIPPQEAVPPEQVTKPVEEVIPPQAPTMRESVVEEIVDEFDLTQYHVPSESLAEVETEGELVEKPEEFPENSSEVERAEELDEVEEESFQQSDFYPENLLDETNDGFFQMEILTGADNSQEDSQVFQEETVVKYPSKSTQEVEELLSQYLIVKKNNPDHFLMFPYDDLYLVINEDARLLKTETDLSTVLRKVENDTVEIFGFPQKLAHGIAEKLEKMGNSVIIYTPDKSYQKSATSNPTPHNTLFFHDSPYSIDLDLSDYEDGELIGYNEKGVRFDALKDGDYLAFTTTTAIGPRGEVLGTTMNQEDYADWKEWVQSTTALDQSKEQQLEISPEIVEESQEDDELSLTQYHVDDEKESNNYKFSPDHKLYSGGAKTKFKANVEAIKTLQLLEEEQREATPEEQVALAGYVGWGGLANALTPNKAGWEKEYEEIKELLTEDEFKSAVSSTLTAYYTEQMVVGKMYQALENAGFKQGTILDPAMGTGNFFSVLPDEMAKSKLYGVELDSVTGRIAQKLYPKADIQVRGFEHTSYPDNFFDVTMGNIPFSDFRVNDPKYNKHKFRIHDYFIAKSIDQVRPNGIIAVISTKGTMDKSNPKMREYVAQRAELVGAIRLPNNAFKQVAGTEVTSDILFFKKREQVIVPNEENTPWLRIAQNEEGIPVNQYFIDHPEMILGKMVYDESMYGNDQTTACHPIEGADLERQLQIAIGYLDFQYEEPTSEFTKVTEEYETREGNGAIEADHRVKNHSYTVVNEQIYFRENSKMYPQDIVGKRAERVKGLVEIHQDVKEIIDYQTDLFIRDTVSQAVFDKTMEEMRGKLNEHYDVFVKKYGFINASANVSAFRQDGAAPLLRTLEKPHPEDKKLWTKNDIFYKPTIQFQAPPTEVYSAQDALMLSINHKGQVDIDFMSSVYKNQQGEQVEADVIIEELKGQIFQDPDKMKSGYPHSGFVVADEYLSGYVKDKLKTAQFYANGPSGRFKENVEALEKVQPEPLKAHEIELRLGSTWIPTEIYQDFIYETCDTAGYNKGSSGILLEYSPYANRYHIDKKGNEQNNVTVTNTYGTKRKNAYEIIEDSLNQQKTEVRDPQDGTDRNGKSKKIYVLNREETILARSKQEELERKFKAWVFADPERSEIVVNEYNRVMNNLVVRRYSGSNLTFPDQNPEIQLRTHQKDVVAHGLFSGGNLLMAHEVGAGKTYSAITLAHEMKRLGTAKKPLITVPNHLVGQWADAFMRLYPDSNIMVATTKDLQKENRKRFIARIATSNYDAIIMPHSSFELISMSKEYKMEAMESEIREITTALASMDKAPNWGTKQMELFLRKLQTRYDDLVEAKVKDEGVNFEQLGVDALFVDESHTYKNNFSYTKLRNVAGIGGTPSQIAMDMHLKAQYINKINHGKGVVYLTGTPVSNTLAELYVIQKTLQPQELEKRGLSAFDNWVSAFAEITAENEIKPEGSGWQMKTRLSHFHNTTEMMKIFRMVADIRTAEMLDEIPVPKATTHNIETKATPIQKKYIKEFAHRGEECRKDPNSKDNFLKITQDARNCAIDPRILDATLPNDPDSKLNVSAQNIASIYHSTEAEKLTQLAFCDKGVPNEKVEFDFYRGLRAELIRCGVPEEQIAFIHDYKTDESKQALFEKVRNGDLRILIGSTAKMGAGLNVQDRLIGVHHIDAPWKPSDLIQRNGRILRQGNLNPEVNIYNYVTGGTFDSYLWQILEKKQKFISQLMKGDDTIRRCDDIDDVVLEYAALKAMAMDNPRLKEKMELDNEVMKLLLLKSSWDGSHDDLRRKVTKGYPTEITNLERNLTLMTGDLEILNENKTEKFSIKLDGVSYDERAKAAEHLGVLCHRLGTMAGASVDLGEYAGFELSLKRIALGGVKLVAQGSLQYSVEIGDSMLGAIARLENHMNKLPEMLEETQNKIEDVKHQLEVAKEEVDKPFPDEERLEELQAKKTQLDLELEFGIGDSMEKEIYGKLQPYLQPLLEGETDHIRYINEPYMPLTVEKIGENEYSICHYYEQNGDLMRDPEITFVVEEGAVTPTSYQQDGMGLYYRCEDVDPSQVRDLKEFMLEWANNIEEQGYDPMNPNQEEELEQ